MVGLGTGSRGWYLVYSLQLGEAVITHGDGKLLLFVGDCRDDKVQRIAGTLVGGGRQFMQRAWHGVSDGGASTLTRQPMRAPDFLGVQDWMTISRGIFNSSWPSNSKRISSTSCANNLSEPTDRGNHAGLQQDARSAPPVEKDQEHASQQDPRVRSTFHNVKSGPQEGA